MVYVISDGNGHCKIGVANNIDARLSQLQSGNPFKLTCLYSIGCLDEVRNICLSSYDVEKLLHKYFKKYRLYGEWFQENKVLDFFELREGRGFLQYCGRNSAGEHMFRRLRFKKGYSRYDFVIDIESTFSDEKKLREFCVGGSEGGVI